jgi:hypothetical protein
MDYFFKLEYELKKLSLILHEHFFLIEKYSFLLNLITEKGNYI